MTNANNQNASDSPDTGRSRPYVTPRPRTRPAPVAPATVAPVSTTPSAISSRRWRTVSAATATKGPKTIKVMENGKVKNRPTGDHATGYGRPPVKNRFQTGNGGGPGRPKGSKSQDTLLREELAAKQSVREGGRSRKVAKRAFLVKMMVNGALEKRSARDLAVINDHARRLFPEQVADTGARAAYDAALDRQVLEQLLGHLQAGEPTGDNVDPFADLAAGAPDLGEVGGGGAWSEGDWDAEGDGSTEEASDGEL